MAHGSNNRSGHVGISRIRKKKGTKQIFLTQSVQRTLPESKAGQGAKTEGLGKHNGICKIQPEIACGKNCWTFLKTLVVKRVDVHKFSSSQSVESVMAGGSGKTRNQGRGDLTSETQIQDRPRTPHPKGTVSGHAFFTGCLCSGVLCVSCCCCLLIFVAGVCRFIYQLFKK